MTAFWGAGCLGVEVASKRRGRSAPNVALRAFFPGLARRRGLQENLAGLWRRSRLPRRPLRLTPVADRRWADIWQRSLRPMRVGRRLLIVPEGCAATAGDRRLSIGVRFGQAFGTGEHASTRMSLRLLEESLRPGDRVADLGTGTAILAMAARRLGAGPTVAVDIDAVALEVAVRNLRDNGLEGQVTLIAGDAVAALDRGPFEVILVNIGAGVILRLLPRIAGALASGGCAILAGLLVEDEASILAGAGLSGLLPDRRLRRRPWAGLRLRRESSA